MLPPKGVRLVFSQCFAPHSTTMDRPLHLTTSLTLASNGILDIMHALIGLGNCLNEKENFSDRPKDKCIIGQGANTDVCPIVDWIDKGDTNEFNGIVVQIRSWLHL